MCAKVIQNRETKEVRVNYFQVPCKFFLVSQFLFPAQRKFFLCPETSNFTFWCFSSTKGMCNYFLFIMNCAKYHKFLILAA